MGCDWYDFSSGCCTGYAVMVTNKDIKEVHNPGSSDETEGGVFHHELKDDEINWLLDQTKGFKLYTLGESFVLIMKENNKILEPPSLSVPGPYEIEDPQVKFKIGQAPPGEEYSELYEVARKLTPQGNKLSFAPGEYSFSMTSGYMMPVKEIERTNDAMMEDNTVQKEAAQPPEKHEPPQLETSIPLDFELIIGEGKNKKTIVTNKAVLSCFITGFEALVGDTTNVTKLELPDLDHDAVQTVLGRFSTREDVKMPDRCWDRSEYDHVQLVLQKFGIDAVAKKAKVDDSEAKHPALAQHPALSNPKWLDTTFVVGQNKEAVKANRAVLASLNPVLNRILFGTKHITVDPTKPIEWPQFTVGAVRQVFLGLVQLGKKEVVVPMEDVESAKGLVDYLMESRKGLHLYYDTPFKKEFLDSFCLVPGGEDFEGLKLE